jgi:hypothetical protein
MDHLSDWHSFDAIDRNTYPKTSSVIQVKYADGGLASGNTFDFFQMLTVPKSPILGWRYMKAYPSR